MKDSEGAFDASMVTIERAWVHFPMIETNVCRKRGAPSLSSPPYEFVVVH